MDTQTPDFQMGGMPWEWPEAIEFREADAARMFFNLYVGPWSNEVQRRYEAAFEQLIEACYTWDLRGEMRWVGIHLTV